MTSILNIKDEINQIKKTIDSLTYGSIEIREEHENIYIYVHYRENGILINRYVGEYSNELYNLILSNNKKVKELKNRLKKLLKEFKGYGEPNNSITDKVKLNIDLARRNLVDSIYKQSVLEGVAATYIDTETLINEGKVHNMSSTDVIKITNLKHAWEFIMDYDVESYPTDYALLCQINRIVQEGLSSTAGKLRSLPVTIGGSTYLPPLPIESDIKNEINKLVNSKLSNEKKAANIVAYIMKSQPFLDGNKRSAIIFGNHFLISRGLGLIVIPVNKLKEYKKLLINYYESKNEKLIEFFIKYCYQPLK